MWCRWYQLWTQFILLWAVYSSFFTPMEFAFFRGLPKKLFLLDIAGQFAFFIDIFVQFRVAYRDSHTYRIVQSPTDIAFRFAYNPFLPLRLTIVVYFGIAFHLRFHFHSIYASGTWSRDLFLTCSVASRGIISTRYAPNYSSLYFWSKKILNDFNSKFPTQSLVWVCVRLYSCMKIFEEFP